MEGLEATHNLNNDFPDVLLLNELLVVLAFADSLEYVAIVSVLHHDTVQKIFIMISDNLTYQSEFEGSSKKASR